MQVQPGSCSKEELEAKGTRAGVCSWWGEKPHSVIEGATLTRSQVMDAVGFLGLGQLRRRAELAIVNRGLCSHMACRNSDVETVCIISLLQFMDLNDEADKYWIKAFVSTCMSLMKAGK